MFSSYPKTLKDYGLRADARTLLDIMHAMHQGLIKNLGDLYSVGRYLTVKKREENAPYTIAFFDYFLGIKFYPGETLDSAVTRSDTFNTWLDKSKLRLGIKKDMNPSTLVNVFLDEVLGDSSAFFGMVSPEELKLMSHQLGIPQEQLYSLLSQGDKAVAPHGKQRDYSGESVDELLRRMEEKAREQSGVHNGGSTWIGKYGSSPYGNRGNAPGGIRVGGEGHGQMARRVLANPVFYPVDVDAMLTDDNVDAALAALKGVSEQSARSVLDIDATIEKGVKRGGIFVPYLKELLEETLQVMLFIDNGGYSMKPYVNIVRQLFGKMKTRFSHDLKVFYFHNILKGSVYSDESREKSPVPLEEILRYSPEHRVFIVGDASMDPYELMHPDWGENVSGIENLIHMRERFPRIAWLNPKQKERWEYTHGSETIMAVKEAIDMFPLTPRGIEDAVRNMNQKMHEPIAVKRPRISRLAAYRR